MTLYWWMHWFWVTAQIAGCMVLGVSSSSVTEISFEDATVTTMETTVEQQSFPFTKALDSDFDKTVVMPLNKNSASSSVVGINAQNLSNETLDNVFTNVTQLQIESKANEKTGMVSKVYTSKKESILKNISKPIRLKHEESTKILNMTRQDNLAVLPLNVDNSSEKDKLSNTNNFRIMNNFTNNSYNQITKKYIEKLVSASVSPPSTEESLRSNRARGTLFTIGLQREQTHLENHFSKLSNEESSIGMYSNNGTSPTNIAIITLSCLATIVLISTAGSLGFIMYRRKYLNPPQTLNSDKCSNPDSSGYIDDSTIRDNSEEMYSLDNDSFLNSLEAMTIQNYWTDSVKHTKL